jgi:hypothetical protein
MNYLGIRKSATNTLWFAMLEASRPSSLAAVFLLPLQPRR